MPGSAGGSPRSGARPSGSDRSARAGPQSSASPSASRRALGCGQITVARWTVAMIAQVRIDLLEFREPVKVGSILRLELVVEFNILVQRDEERVLDDVRRRLRRVAILVDEQVDDIDFRQIVGGEPFGPRPRLDQLLQVMS